MYKERKRKGFKKNWKNWDEEILRSTGGGAGGGIGFYGLLISRISNGKKEETYFLPVILSIFSHHGSAEFPFSAKGLQRNDFPSPLNRENVNDPLFFFSPQKGNACINSRAWGARAQISL